MGEILLVGEIRSKKLYIFTILLTLLMFLSQTLFSITVYAPKGSMIYFNDRLMGIVQKDALSFTAELPGVLKVVKPGYIPYEETITEDATITVELSLPSFLNIKLTPAGAKIFVDGKAINSDPGTGIARFQIGFGIHEIVVQAPEYATKTLKVEVSPYEEKNLEISLKRTVTLKLISDKRIDNVIFNGETISIPTSLEVTPGKHKIYLPINFLKNIQEFEVPFVDEYTYKVDSTQLYKLSIDGTPGGAYASIAGQVFKLPNTLLLPESTYEVRIYSEGYEEYATKVDLRKDSVLFYNLKPKSEVSIRTFKDELTVEYDGYERSNVVFKTWFTTIKDATGNVVWYGFSDGTIKDTPKSIPVIISKDIVCVIDGKVFKGPTILQVASGSTVLLYDQRKGNSQEKLQVNRTTVVDSEDRVLVNIYSKDAYEVYWDDKFVGTTPIYFFVTTAGKHKLVFVRNDLKVDEKIVETKKGHLNEFRPSF